MNSPLSKPKAGHQALILAICTAEPAMELSLHVTCPSYVPWPGNLWGRAQTFDFQQTWIQTPIFSLIDELRPARLLAEP